MMENRESSIDKERIEAKKDEYWRKSGECPLFKEKLYESQEKMQKFFDNLPEFKKAFFKEDDGESVLVCIDEGLNVEIPENGRRKIRIAGAGMLMFEEMNDEQIKNFLDINEIKKIITHKKCGASGKHRDEHKKIGTHHTRCWAEKFKKEHPDCNLEYNHESDHIHIKDMDRPEEFHDARIVYVDMVGGFDPSDIKSIPKGFVFSAKAIMKTSSITDKLKMILDGTKLSSSIALGDHGFGERFNEEPFLIAPIISSKKEIIPTENKFKKIIEEDELIRGKVLIRPIVTPKLKTTA